MSMKRPLPRADAELDVGDRGCGEIVMELRIAMQSLSPGRVLKVTARDAGAPEDLPAWCRMTGHTLLAADHPEYWIAKKKEL